MMKKIKKGKIRSVKDIKVIVRFKGQSESVFYTNGMGDKYYPDFTLYGDVFPANGALCGAREKEAEADFLRQAFRRRNATAKIMRMSNYCSSMKGMLTDAIAYPVELPTAVVNGSAAETDLLPVEEILRMSQKKTADDPAGTVTGEDEDGDNVKVHAEYRDRDGGEPDGENDENSSGYVEVSTTGKLIEYERHYMISYSEYFQPFEEPEIYNEFENKREVSVLIFKNNPDVVMISYNEFNDEFLTFVKNKTTVDFYSDDFNEPYSGFESEYDANRDFGTAPPAGISSPGGMLPAQGMVPSAGIDYLTINTGDVTSTINSDNGDLKLNYTVGLFSGMLGFAEYSLKYQVL